MAHVKTRSMLTYDEQPVRFGSNIGIDIHLQHVGTGERVAQVQLAVPGVKLREGEMIVEQKMADWLEWHGFARDTGAVVTIDHHGGPGVDGCLLHYKVVLFTVAGMHKAFP